MEKKDYYAILKINKNASAEEIRKAYRKLALVYHPDRNKSKNAEKMFKEINEAYQVLSNPQKRSEYDNNKNYPGENTNSYQNSYRYYYNNNHHQHTSSPSEQKVKKLDIMIMLILLGLYVFDWYKSRPERMAQKEKLRRYRQEQKYRYLSESDNE